MSYDILPLLLQCVPVLLSLLFPKLFATEEGCLLIHSVDLNEITEEVILFPLISFSRKDISFSRLLIYFIDDVTLQPGVLLLFGWYYFNTSFIRFYFRRSSLTSLNFSILLNGRHCHWILLSYRLSCHSYVSL